jgi:regulator of protease activity HflC (stomatin/prohibitin superfamily)
MEDFLFFTDFTFYLVVAVLLLALLAAAIKILREYERGVIFTLGRFTGVKGSGLIILIPYVQQMVRTDLRTLVLDVPSKNFMQATSELAQTTLRSVLGKHELDEMLAERDQLNNDIQSILDAQTDAWGIKVANVEIKHVDLNEIMVRAIARQAEAERERRAKIINAEGEQQAAAKLLEAAEILARRPEAMQLRYLSTLNTIAGEKSSTIVFPFPVEMAKFFSGAGDVHPAS